MQFEISRTSETWGKTPCEEARQITTFRVDERTKDAPEKINAYQGQSTDWWYKEGRNHRVERGHIKRDIECRTWVIDIETLDDLWSLYKKYGELIIRSSRLNNGMNTIEIYDDYRE